ncbi:ead/Ea22-like family protein [Citrobacter portucalensis]|uniref:Ead/Ea22-like family protein n=1 Tax=Citrobacter portucalensis TaxID=1639133 RepID=A0ABD5H4B7_9ENTR|nr:ead/Ea22-like family protein [Citrobacter portucalensis]MDW2635911.1 ead/Ea22-like family protein [Citrobacter portucalensis]
MTALNKQALRVLAVALDGDDWHAEGNSVYGGRYDVGDNVCYDLIASCESVNGESPHADFIAAANPATVLALMDELEAAEHTAAVDHEAACSLVEENEEVKRKLAAAEKCIAELEAFISQSCYVFDGRDADISDSYIDASTSSLMPKVSTKNEGEPCRYCSDGSYSGLPGGACEHCMGTGLDNPAAGIGVKGE